MKVEVKEIVTRIDIETKHLKLNDVRGDLIHNMNYQSPYTSYGVYGEKITEGSGSLCLKFYDDDLGMITVNLEPSHKHQEENVAKAYTALRKFF